MQFFMAFYGKYGTIKVKYRNLKFHALKRRWPADVLERQVALWTVFQQNSKFFYDCGIFNKFP